MTSDHIYLLNICGGNLGRPPAQTSLSSCGWDILLIRSVSRRGQMLIEISVALSGSRFCDELKRRFSVRTPVALVALYAMLFAMLHPEQFDSFLDTLIDYTNAEGLDGYIWCQGRLAAR
jgi:hypothetical protein